METKLSLPISKPQEEEAWGVGVSGDKFCGMEMGLLNLC